MAQQFKAFPYATREVLAHLELEYERGEITEQEYASQETAAIEAARTQLKLGPEWRTDDNATERDYLSLPVHPPMVKTFENGVPVMKPDAAQVRSRPARRTMCFWLEA
jgi:hypothetical protein